MGAALAAAWSALLAAGIAAVAGAGLGTGSAAQPEVAGAPSVRARREIPAPYLALYLRAAARYSLDWAILAAIGRVECDHGRDPDPSCTRHGAVNAAGAGGPMQFIASTWSRFGVDGEGNGVADRWDPTDAIFAAANYMRASGAPDDNTHAILAYNHDRSYLAEVERWAHLYRAQGGETSSDLGDAGAGLPAATPTPVLFIPGARAMLDPSDGHVALVPVDVPAAVQAMIVAGNELQALPYGPGGHPDPRGAPEEDCSSTVNYVLYRAGVRPIAEITHDNPLAQDYIRWGAPGPGRWVSMLAASAPTAHAFIVIAGLRLDTSHHGTDLGPNRAQDGPRWRLLDHLPRWARWSIRHPPGL